MDASRVLLFVVSLETRSLSSMALAAHYIGLGCNVVLCIQRLPDNAEINGDRVSNEYRETRMTKFCTSHAEQVTHVSLLFYLACDSFRLSPSKTTIAVGITFPIWPTARESRSLTKSRRRSNVPFSAVTSSWCCYKINRLKSNNNNDEKYCRLPCFFVFFFSPIFDLIIIILIPSPVMSLFFFGTRIDEECVCT